MTNRIANDFYPTPDKLIRKYLENNPNLICQDETILEPCMGDGAIANPLIEMGYKVTGTDITNGLEYDATKIQYWANRSPDWVFTNPPFKAATPILDLALQFARKGVVMLLRASYLEPCKDRRDLLNNRINQITYCNPRPKFRADTKGSDSATVIFIVWHKLALDRTKIDYLIDWHK